ncbi:hypothetical protein HK096_009328, partial [Nowakowskiella sp. JEL0078]
MEQLRVANLFFLTLVVVQILPQFATINPVIAALPFVVIILLTAGKDGLEDVRRHKSDETINNQQSQTLHNWSNVNECFFDQTNKRHQKSTKIHPTPPQLSKTSSTTSVNLDDVFWYPTAWKHINVGDFVKICNNEGIPADMVVLATSEPDGLCYIETKNLDGETNLKIKTGVLETSMFRTAREFAELSVVVESEAPSPSLYGYTGTLIIDAVGMAKLWEKYGRTGKETVKLKKISIGINGILLRGCILRNTEWVVGLVVYTGEDTKIMLNSGETPSKRSLVERKMNPFIMVNLGFLVIMCVVNAIGSPLWEAKQFIDRPLWLDSTFTSEPPNW